MRDGQRELRALAEMEAGPLPVVSVYPGVRPQATRENPAVRAGMVVLRDRLREAQNRVLRGDDDRAHHQRHHAGELSELAWEKDSEPERLVESEGARRPWRW